MQVARRISTWHDGGGEPAYWGLCFTAEEDGATVSMSPTGTPSAVTLETSFDGKNWNAFSPDGDTPVTLASAGDRVYFRAGAGGNTTISTSTSKYRTFTISGGLVAASGNIMSLLDGEDSENTVLETSYSFVRLFQNCTHLTAAPELPATTLAFACYRQMFQNCTSLTAAPVLPAPVVPQNAYWQMFYGCQMLSSVEVAFTEWPAGSGALVAWLLRVAEAGVFKCPAALGTNETIERGTSRCPEGWTVVNI